MTERKVYNTIVINISQSITEELLNIIYNKCEFSWFYWSMQFAEDSDIEEESNECTAYTCYMALHDVQKTSLKNYWMFKDDWMII